MMPVKEILAMHPKESGPPIIVIDETTICNTSDTGPVCGCYEKFQSIHKYTPFIPGGVNPYKRRNIPNKECLAIDWRILRIGTEDLLLEKPVAMHLAEIPNNFTEKNEKEEDLMLTRVPVFTEEYYKEKLYKCQRQHVEGCDCPC